MEAKITPKSCSKVLFLLQSQVKETKLFCDGQTKARDKGEMDPAYGKTECFGTTHSQSYFNTTQ